MTEQNMDGWESFWEPRTTEDEIRMADFYSGRQFIVKFLPRWGKVIEAGCGLGRYVWHLSDLGFDIVGVDKFAQVLDLSKNWAEENSYDPDLVEVADISDLPYPDDYFAGYISLGVIEHFQEGPQRALEEAFRVLRPGGVAIIETPNRFSYDLLYSRTRDRIRSLVRRTLVLLGIMEPRSATNSQFFQHEYSVNRLGRFVADAGFAIFEKRTIDLKYPSTQIFERYGESGRKWRRRLQPWLFRFLDVLEDTPLRIFGGLSMVIAVKPGPDLGCFNCGQPSGSTKDLEISDIGFPFCNTCLAEIPQEVLSNYRKGVATRFKSKNLKTYSYGHDGWHLNPEKGVCGFCHNPYRTHPWFGDFGFSEPVCSECVKEHPINLALSNSSTEQIWGEYSHEGTNES